MFGPGVRGLPECPGIMPEGLTALEPVPSQLMGWLCAGMLAGVRATFSAPPTSPRTILAKPAPWPVPTGARPCRSGSLKLVVPLPPKVVPRMANSAVLVDMLRSCPAQKDYPRGAKLPANIAILPIYGSVDIAAIPFVS